MWMKCASCVVGVFFIFSVVLAELSIRHTLVQTHETSAIAHTQVIASYIRAVYNKRIKTLEETRER